MRPIPKPESNLFVHIWTRICRTWSAANEDYVSMGDTEFIEKIRQLPWWKSLLTAPVMFVLSVVVGYLQAVVFAVSLLALLVVQVLTYTVLMPWAVTSIYLLGPVMNLLDKWFPCESCAVPEPKKETE